jgi:ABC-type nitrate/sulfonate/bicarbonate transport system substrate-binding protein
LTPFLLRFFERGAEDMTTKTLKLGIIPLTDCAPLVVAQEKGFFHRQGLAVEISREASWATIRDKVAVGLLDGAHMLAGMPIAAQLGLGGIRKPAIAGLVLGLNGNAITLATELYARMIETDPAAATSPIAAARALRVVIEAEREAGSAPRVFAVTFPVATHNYELRLWLASAGIDPDRDVRLTVVPPPQMPASLESGRIDGFCAGAPWNSLAVALDVGRIVATKHQLLCNAPEKVFGVNEEWAEREKATHQALLRALIEACRWVDEPANRAEAAQLLVARHYLDAPIEIVLASLAGRLPRMAEEIPDFLVFYRYAATFPWRSYADWTVVQMLRWGQIGAALDIRRVADRAYRTDLYRSAAAELGIAAPLLDRRPHGVHPLPWVLEQATAPIAMGADRFFDGSVFDPADPVAHLAALGITQLRVPPGELAALNPSHDTVSGAVVSPLGAA